MKLSSLHYIMTLWSVFKSLCFDAGMGDLAREQTRMTSAQVSGGMMGNSLRRRSKEDGMVTRSKSRMMRK